MPVTSRRVGVPTPGVVPDGTQPATTAHVQPVTRGKLNLLAEVDFDFPEIPNEPKKSLEECTILLYGEKKIGKTTLAASFPEPLILATEPGAGGIRAVAPPVDTWMAFKAGIAKLRETSRFRTVAIDTLDRLYEQCFAYVCAREGFVYPPRGDYGAGWKAIAQEWVGTMDEFWKARGSRGLIQISHAQSKAFDNYDGSTINKIVPSAPDRALAYASAMNDIIIYLGYFGEQRLMSITGSDTLEAGQRLPERFWVKDRYEIERVHSIPAGNTPKEAYNNLVRAFSNEQPSSGNPEFDAVLVRPKKMVKKQPEG